MIIRLEGMINPRLYGEFNEDDYKRISYASVKPQANAFAQYCAEDVIEGFKLSDWKTMEEKQPRLVQFTVDHALPISISDCERSFSSAKFTLNLLRVCMKYHLFEALGVVFAEATGLDLDTEDPQNSLHQEFNTESLITAY